MQQHALENSIVRLNEINIRKYFGKKEDKGFFYFFISMYAYKHTQGVCSVMVIVGNGHGDLSSNPG